MNQGCCVYVMQIAGQHLVKIGISVDPNKRRTDLQAAGPHKIVLCESVWFSDVEKAKDIEQKLLRKFRQKKTRGEWVAERPSTVLRALESLPETSEAREFVRAMWNRCSPNLKVSYGR